MVTSLENKVDRGRELQRVLNLHKAGRLDQAQAIYYWITGIEPVHADALHLSGLIHSEKGDLTKAGDLIQRAIQADKDEPVFPVSLGDMLQRQEQHGRAVACYLKALALNPDSVEALCNMGNALREMGCHRQAIACHKQVIEINPICRNFITTRDWPNSSCRNMRRPNPVLKRRSH